MSYNSIVVVIAIFLLNISMGVLDRAPLYIGQVDFQEILANAGEGENLQQLDEVFNGFIGGPDSQLSQEPIEFSNTAQAVAANFVGLSTPDTQANFPEFNNLLDSLQAFGFKKGSMEIAIDEQQIPLKDSLFDILLSD